MNEKSETIQSHKDQNRQNSQPEGIVLVDKPAGITSFGVVARLRRKLQVKKIGHSGTLDPFATGLLVMLVGRKYTRLADSFLCDDKEYEATLLLGSATDTYDLEGKQLETSDYVPTLEEVTQVLSLFQGKIEQVPPMFSAKKVEGKRLYEIARKGGQVERKACLVEVKTTLLSYEYPKLSFHVECSKGTYIRSIAHEIGQKLGSFGHLIQLRRIRSGKYSVKDSTSLDEIMKPESEVRFLYADL